MPVSAANILITAESSFAAVAMGARGEKHLVRDRRERQRKGEVNGMYEPVHGAFLRRAALKAFEYVFEANKRKPSDAYAKLNLEFVDEASLREVDRDLESFWNLNSPEDLRLAESRLAGMEEPLEDKDY